MKARLVWLLLCGIWGSTWLFIKIGLRDLPPISFAAIRFLIAVIILAAIILVRRLSLPRSSKDWWMLAGTGVLAFALNYGLIFWGEQYISSGLAALLQATIPAFGFVFAHVYLPGAARAAEPGPHQVGPRHPRARFDPILSQFRAISFTRTGRQPAEAVVVAFERLLHECESGG